MPDQFWQINYGQINQSKIYGSVVSLKNEDYPVN